MAYGTTENSPVTFMNFAEDTVQEKAESVGRVMPHTEVSPRPYPPLSWGGTLAPQDSYGTFLAFN